MNFGHMTFIGVAMLLAKVQICDSPNSFAWFVCNYLVLFRREVYPSPWHRGSYCFPKAHFSTTYVFESIFLECSLFFTQNNLSNKKSVHDNIEAPVISQIGHLTSSKMETPINCVHINCKQQYMQAKLPMEILFLMN